MSGPDADPEALAAVMRLIARTRRTVGGRPAVIGLCGAQGSGKSTLAAAVASRCAQLGLICPVLSIDDLYLTLAERQALARDVHPLLRTRGPPGTHDVALGMATLHSLIAGEAEALPRFDKARDDRMPAGDWPMAPAHCDVVVFEGWCVGARPEPPERLHVPVNALEAREDADGVWRGHVNAALAGSYSALFALLDSLVLLAAPEFAVVPGWRRQQEEELRARTRGDGAGIMDSDRLERFVSHYERLTRWILAEMPARADLTIRLDRMRRAIAFEYG